MNCNVQAPTNIVSPQYAIVWGFAPTTTNPPPIAVFPSLLQQLQILTYCRCLEFAPTTTDSPLLPRFGVCSNKHGDAGATLAAGANSMQRRFLCSSWASGANFMQQRFFMPPCRCSEFAPTTTEMLGPRWLQEQTPCSGGFCLSKTFYMEKGSPSGDLGVSRSSGDLGLSRPSGDFGVKLLPEMRESDHFSNNTRNLIPPDKFPIPFFNLHRTFMYSNFTT